MKRSLFFNHIATERVNFASQRCQSIGFVQTQMPDSS